MANPTGKGGFKKGDPRINRKGRPKNFDKLRELALQIAHEEAKAEKKCVVINGKKATVAEMILRKWATSKNPTLQKSFMEIAFGKVPNNLDITSGGQTIVSDGKQTDRALLTLANTLREEIPSENGGSDGSVVAAE